MLRFFREFVELSRCGRVRTPSLACTLTKSRRAGLHSVRRAALRGARGLAAVDLVDLVEMRETGRARGPCVPDLRGAKSPAWHGSAQAALGRCSGHGARRPRRAVCEAIGKCRRDPAHRGRQAEGRRYVVRVDCRSRRRVPDQHERRAVPDAETRGSGVRGGNAQRQRRRPPPAPARCGACARARPRAPGCYAFGSTFCILLAVNGFSHGPTLRALDLIYLYFYDFPRARS